MNLMDILSPGLSNPRMAAQVGSPLLSALLMKHGGGGGDAAAAAVPAPAPGPAAAPQVGSDMSNAGMTANIVDALPSFTDGAPKDATVFGKAGMDGINSSLAANAAKPRGFLDRIGDFLHSDEGRAALLRSGAATLQGGLGAGIQAGANFMDERRHERDSTATENHRLDLQERHLNNEDEYRRGQLDLQGEQNENTRQYQSGQLENDRYRTNSENYRSGLHETHEDYRTGVHEKGETGRTVYNQSAANYRHDHPSGDTVYSQDQTTYREQNPVATPPAPHPNTLTTHVHYTTTPDEYARNGPRLRPSEVKPSGGPAKISTDAEYNALPSGTSFVGPDGQTRVKP